jgi:hypothetical protein
MAFDRLKGPTDLSDRFAAMLEELVRRGFARPIRFVALGVNGAVMAGRMDDGPGGTLVPVVEVQHTPPEGIWLPLNFMWIDATGTTAIRAVIDPTGIAYH